MQFEFLFAPNRSGEAGEDWLRVGGRTIKLRMVRNRRARRYVLRLARDGAARVTIPRGGSAVEATRFARKNMRWLERQLLLQSTRSRQPKAWTAGTQILFRGRPVRLECSVEGTNAVVRFGGESVQVASTNDDLRPQIERHLWNLAARELPSRVMELAALHQFRVQRVSIRNQRSRWGSCSRLGTISLNWRLVHAPVFVRDYIILHELAHLKHMNHSARFWHEVARLCPNFGEAEKWLKQHSLESINP